MQKKKKPFSASAMDVSNTDKDASKASRSSRTSKRAKKLPQSATDSERDKELSRSSRKRRKSGADKPSKLRTDTRAQEIVDDREQTSVQRGTQEVTVEAPTITAADTPGTGKKEEPATLSHLPTAELPGIVAGTLHPLGPKVPPSSESQALLPTARDDSYAAPTSAPDAQVTTVAAEQVQLTYAEPQHTTRTIRKVTGVQTGAEAEAAVKQSCPLEEPKAVPLTARTQAVPEQSEEGKNPAAFRNKIPDVTKMRKYCAGVSCVILAFIVMVLLAFRTPPEERRYKTCDTLACAAYSKRLRESINSSVHPCDSFTHYVCGGWRTSYEISVNDDAVLASLSRMYQIFRDMKSLRSGQSLLQRAAVFYLSCECVAKAGCNELLNVAQALEAAKVVWPLRAHHPDLLRTLLHVSLRLRWDGILALDITTSGTKKRVLVRPSHEFYILGHKAIEQRRSHGRRQNYFEVLKKAFKSASSTHFHGDLVTFEETKSLELKIWDELWDNNYIHPEANVRNSYLFSFVPNLTLPRWKEAMADFGVTINTEDDLQFFTNAGPLLIKFLKMWRQYGEDEMHLLISWWTVQVAALFANQELLMNFYGSKHKAERGHRAFCFGKTFAITGDALLHRFSHATLPGNLIPEARGLILDVRQAMHRQLVRWKYYNKNVTVVFDWDNTSLSLLYFDQPEGGKDTRREGLVDMGQSLVANWLLAARDSFLKPSSWQLSKVIQELALYVLHTESEQPDLSLLPYAFSFPYFDHGATRALNYAGIGSRVAEALGGLFFSAYFAQPEKRWVFTDHLICMRNATATKLEHSSYGPLLEPLSVQTALYAYRARNADTDVRVGGLEFLTSEQLFFVAACYVRCVRTSGSMRVAGASCDTPFRHVAEFASAFECAPGSYMNPAHRCELLKS